MNSYQSLILWLLVASSLGFQSTLITKQPVSSQFHSLSHLEPVRLQPFVTHAHLTSNVRSSVEDTQDEDKALQNSGDWFPRIVFPLLLVYISNQWSRSSLYYLVDFSDGASAFSAMNVDVGFSESQYGLLASVAFTALFAVASLGAGIVSDKLDRKALTLYSTLGWAVATLGTALSSSFSEVALCRVGMGLACAFTTPAAYTLIQDYVPADRRALATSIYGSGVALGGSLASLSILLDKSVGWQEATILISGFAVLSACIIQLALPSDTNRIEVVLNDDKGVVSPLAGIETVVSQSKTQWIYTASFFRFCAGLCIGVWSAAYFKSAYPANASEYAVAQAAITGIAGSSSGILGGFIADKVSAQAPEGSDGTSRILWIPAVASALAAPLFYFAINADTFDQAILWLAVEYLVAECWFGPTITALLSTIDDNVKGTGQGLFTMTGAVANLAPAVVGFYIADSTTATASGELPATLCVAVCSAYVVSSVVFAVSATTPIEAPYE